MTRSLLPIMLAAAAFAALSNVNAADARSFKFDFGPGKVAPGYTAILPSTIFTKDVGYGFEPDYPVEGFNKAGSDPLRDDGCASAKPFYFTVNLPEGNYRVTVTLGNPAAESTTTIKAELRRLMVEGLHTAPGKRETVSFVVNTRTPQIAAVDDIKAGEVKLKTPREVTQEAWAWDGSLTLEFNGTHPSVCALEIAPAEVPTVFLIGDSTVCDQSREPFASWGQMFTRFFKPEIAIANHGESGETYRDSIGRRRLDKMLSVMKPGDYLFMQFGHNDQKQIAGGNGGPFTTYPEEIQRHVEAVQKRGGKPVIVSPMERRRFNASGKVEPSLADYAKSSHDTAEKLGVPFIDLNAMCMPFYEAIEAKGKDASRQAFAGNDNTHHSNYGAYELAKCVVQGIVNAKLDLAKHVIADWKTFDPAHPDPVESFGVPPSPQGTTVRPLGE